jgi:hypothetical protein
MAEIESLTNEVVDIQSGLEEPFLKVIRDHQEAARVAETQKTPLIQNSKKKRK